MRISRATAEAIRYACLKFHYAKAIPSVSYGYNVFNDNDEWCGCICYGTGANYNIGTEYGLVTGEVLELVRVALNGKQGITSKAVSLSMKQLHKDAPLVKLIVSYADVDQNHYGTLYQALSFIYVGTHVGDRYFIINGKKTHRKTIHSRGVKNNLKSVQKYLDPKATEFFSLGKRKYLFSFDKKLREEIQKKALPYPKKEEKH